MSCHGVIPKYKKIFNTLHSIKRNTPTQSLENQNIASWCFDFIYTDTTAYTKISNLHRRLAARETWFYKIKPLASKINALIFLILALFDRGMLTSGKFTVGSLS